MHRLTANDGNVSLTSRELGIPRPTLILWRDGVAKALDRVPVSTVTDTLEPTPDPQLDLATRIVRESAFIAFGHLRDIASWDKSGNVTFIPSEELAEGASAGIQSIEYETKDDLVGDGEVATVMRTTKIKVKRESKLGALALLAKIAGLIQTAPQVNVDQSQHLTLPADLSLDELRAIAGGQ